MTLMLAVAETESVTVMTREYVPAAVAESIVIAPVVVSTVIESE